MGCFLGDLMRGVNKGGFMELSVSSSQHYLFVRGGHTYIHTDKHTYIHTDKHTYIHTEDRNRGNPVETEIPRRARYWLVDITGL